MKTIAIVFGTLIALLGALWLLQGLGLVTMKPILCFANCTPIEGPAPLWAIIGAVALIAGMHSIRFGLRRSRQD